MIGRSADMGGQCMPSLEAIEAISTEIAETFHPDRIILFGSYAYGEPTEDSDVDFLVVLPTEGRNSQKAIEILSRVAHPFPLDIITRSPEEIARRLDEGDMFIRDIITRGKLLYEKLDH